MEHFLDTFTNIVKEYANEPAVSDETSSFTYQEFYDYILNVAANLQLKGIKRGDCVIIEINRCKEYAACLFGCWFAGAVAVPLSDDYPQDRLEYIKNDSKYQLIIDDNFISSLNKKVEYKQIEFRFDNEAFVIYTSGSTGNPKGVVHDFYSIYSVVERNISHDKTLEKKRNDIYGLTAPFTFIVGISTFLSAIALKKHIVIISDEIRKDPYKLAAYYDENNIQQSFIPPRMVDFMLKHNNSLKIISVGSERITNIYFDDNPVVTNGYGSTETFGGILAFKIDKKYDNTPIGKPIGQEKAYVLDENNNEVNHGELCLTGYLATRYINREEETKRAFVPNPFKDRDGFDRMFRTGDIVERLPDGNLVFVDRKDWMIKINGQRVEPLEVEKTIRRLDGIKEVAIKDFTAKNGITYLAAYYVCEKELDQEDIKKYCKDNLSSYMVPTFYIKMDTLPLNPNGKLDRINLPEPDISSFKAEYVPPINKIEENICKAIEEVLQCGKVGRNDDFFLVGGDSIKVMETINILDDLPLTSELFFTGRTPAKIAQLIENGGEDDGLFEKTNKSEYPLTSSQLGVYFTMQENPNTLVYNNPISIKLDKDIDSGLLIKAIDKAINNHEVYHCYIKEVNGYPCMIPNDNVFHAQIVKTKNIEKELIEFVKPFDITSGELIRVTLFEDDKEKVLALDGHHIAFDGTTLSILLKEISKGYEGKDIYEEKYSAFDLSTYEEKLKKTEKYANAQKYYENIFEGLEISNDMPYDYENKDISSLESIEKRFSIDSQKLLKFLKGNGITENSLFLAAYSYVLAKYNGNEKSVVYVGESGRHTSATFNTAGMLVKTIALPIELDKHSDIGKYIFDIQELFRNNVSNDAYPFSELASKYGLLNDFMFVYQGDNFSNLKLNKKDYPVLGLSVPDAMTKLTLMVFSDHGEYRLSFRYRSDLFSKEVIDAFADAYQCAINEFLTKEYLKEVKLVNNEQIKQLNEFHRKDLKFENKNVDEYFDEWVHKTPEHDLIVYKDMHITYKEASKITNKLAKYIVDLGLKNNDVVAILIPRNEWMVLATYGVIKSGCAYEPLDPSYPSERLSFMIKNAKAKLLITTHDLAGLIKDYDKNILFLEDIDSLNDCDEIVVKNNPDDLFVLLYTSGTTGVPKGAMLTYGNTSALVQTNKNLFELDNKVICACYASYGFDACMNDITTIPSVGGTIHIISEDIRLDLNVLDEYYTKNKISHGFMTTQIGRQFALMTKSPYLKKLLVGGETLVPIDNADFNFSLVNIYGPTECTVYVTSHDVKDHYNRVPIGLMNNNTRGYIVDKNLNRLPIGAPGELLIAGNQVGKGYLDLPDNTKAAFIQNPFDNNPDYNRVYRTGDIVRFLPNGLIDFIGRSDGQVKIRGFRVELTEIEEIIRRFEGIKDATVAAFDDAIGGKYIAAYVVSDKKIDVDKLNKFILSEKPSYMVPAVTMQIDKIPLNQNQKVNRKALPKPEREVGNVSLPQNSIQQKIYDVCSNILGHKSFGIDTNLYEAGLTSIGVVRLNVELEKEFNVPFKINDIKTNNTVILIEQFLSSSKQISRHDLQSDYPITKTQMGIYIECSSNKNSINYNIPMFLKLGKKIDINILVSSIKKAIDAHPYIKTELFADNKGDIRARRNDDIECSVEIVKCDKVDTKDLVKPFDLLNNQLYRIAIFQTKEDNYLFMDFHHIISDGTSENIILADISKAYRGESVAKEGYTGYELALDEETTRESEQFVKAKEYYDSVFKGCEADCLPLKAPEKDHTGATSIIRISKTLSNDVDNFCKKNSVTPNAYFNAAFAYALSFFANFEDAVYTTIYNGRNDSRLANAVTMLVKTLPILVHTEGSIDILGMIKDTQKQLINSMSNDIYSFAEISNAYGIRSDIIFAYQGSEFIFNEFCDEKAEFIKVAPDSAKAPITVTVYKKDGKYEIHCDYLQETFNSTLINNLLEVFDLVLSGFHINNKTDEINILSKEAEEKINQINNTDKKFNNIPVNKMIEDMVKKDPNKIAVICNNEKLSFKELNDKANKIANYLIKKGIKKDSVVGLLLNRTSYIPVCELAILKAGGAFLPILPDYPDDRVEFCLNDSDCKIVLTTNEIKESKKDFFAKKANFEVVVVEDLENNKEVDNPNINIDDDALAYCIYTSGSTGQPKGVMIEHHNLSNFVQTFCVAKDMFMRKDGGEVGVAFGSISFDIHIIEILLPLSLGKSIVIANEKQIHNPIDFTDLLVENNVDVMACTPSFIMNMIGIDYFEKALKNIKSIMVGAEAFPTGLYESLKKVSPNIYVVNAYGPTECTVSASSKHITSSNDITIGAPADNYKIYIVDKYNRILPIYATGELIICGEGVGRGYVKLPEKNAQSFFEINGIKAYHSGDMARYNLNGEVQFSGRLDNQVKLRGYRVELDEVENAICRFDGIKQSKVVVRNNGTEDYLVGFFTSNTKVDIDELTKHLKSILTYYMVPDVLMQLDAMPLTANGKIDKKALPEAKKEHKNKIRKVPKKSTEQELCELFANVLNLDEFYADDNFFEMGGTSLSASKVAMNLMSKGLKVEYQDIFDNPTPETLGEFIDGLNKTKETEKKYGDDVEIKSDYPEQLKYNKLEYAKDVKREPLGNVLLSGAVGFLGIHVLKELMDINEGNIICLVRKGTFSSPENRLRSMLIYYFGKSFDDIVSKRVKVIEADITDNVLEVLKDEEFDTIINCAACVKHYAADDILERINVYGVENLTKVAIEKNARLIQISTISIPGAHTEETYKKHIKMYEDRLFVIDSMGNKYGLSKYHGELKVLEAIKNGMRGKIIRVGNLMGRQNDGEFQINFNTNAFLNAVRGFATIGKSPISHATDKMSFSPIDMTAKAIVLLAGTNDKFTAFNCDNRFIFDEWQLIEAANQCGVTIIPVPDDEYYADYYRMLGDTKVNAKLQGLMTNDRPDIHGVESDNTFTANVLYRLGFSWKLPDQEYLQKAINSLLTLDYFEEDDE